MNKKYEYLIDGSAGKYPVEIYYAVVITEEEEISILPKYPFQGEWGITTASVCKLDDFHLLPTDIDLVYLSICEQKFYYINQHLESEKIQNSFAKLASDNDSILRLIIGMGPYGRIALWVMNKNESLLLFNGVGIEISEKNIKNFLPQNISLADYCLNYKIKANLQADPVVKLCMKQYQYRFQIIFGDYKNQNLQQEDNKQPQLVSISSKNYDGTYYNREDNYLTQYHLTGKPKKIMIRWNFGKSEYKAFFFIDEIKITDIFDRFYGVHSDTKVDFIIYIDTDKQEYRLALYRQGIRQPIEISKEVYQVIVFKNKFEDYRSENYNQPRGAWIW